MRPATHSVVPRLRQRLPGGRRPAMGLAGTIAWSCIACPSAPLSCGLSSGRITCTAGRTRPGMDDPGKDGHDNATTGQDRRMRYVELRRHTDNDDDRLTPRGAADAEMIGRDLLHPPYAVFVSTGAARATQMLEILRRAAGQDDTPITAATGLRSSVEGRWREAAMAAGRGADLDAVRAIDPD